jgi:hypothetical protein
MASKYEEFIGKEPSLNDLETFVRVNKQSFEEFNEECLKENRKEDIIDVSVIYEYLKFAKTYGGHYYVGGHIKTYPNDPIRDDYIKKARKQNTESQPMHMAEVASKARSFNELNNLGKILEVYYEKCLEEYYAPPSKNSLFQECGGEGYQKVANETLIGKKI